MPAPLCKLAHALRLLRRFLRARGFNLNDAHTMLVACLEWRRTVDGKGLATLYKEMDPFDVCHWPDAVSI